MIDTHEQRMNPDPYVKYDDIHVHVLANGFTKKIFLLNLLGWTLKMQFSLD